MGIRRYSGFYLFDKLAWFSFKQIKQERPDRKDSAFRRGVWKKSS